nr:hypothetical protein [Nanoarchaeum sp.]
MVDFQTIFYQLEDSGFYLYFLPFMLVFVILFAILEKTFIFGKMGDKDNPVPKTNINVVVALIISLFMITRTDLVLIMNNYLSKMSFFIVIAVMVLIVIAMFTGKDTNAPAKLAAGIAIIAAIWSLASGTLGNDFPYWYYLSDSSFSLLLFIGIFGLVVWLLMNSSKPSNPPKPGKP